ncbi:MAG: hypothetical protein ACYC5Z_08685, partial [Acidimicrobiales bacterium]
MRPSCSSIAVRTASPRCRWASAGDTLRCVYLGWVVDEDGRCVEIPALGDGATLPSRARLSTPAGIYGSRSMPFVASDGPLTPGPRI